MVLAGIGLLHLVDDALLSDTTLPGNFLVPASPVVVGSSVADMCAKGLKEMNPLVDVAHEVANPQTHIRSICQGDGKALEAYSAVLAFDMPATIIHEIDTRCASINVPFCACTSRGVSGWIFVNPQRHEFIVENCTEDEKTGEVKKTVEKKSVTGVAFGKVVEEMVAAAAAAKSDLAAPRRRKRRSAVFDVIIRCVERELRTGRTVSTIDMEALVDQTGGPGHAEHTEDAEDAEEAVALADYLEGACVPAVNAVLGGIMANDVIKLVSGKGSLGVDRMFCYSVVEDAGWTL